MSKFDIELADIIRDKRLDLLLTQEDVAKKLNITRSAYANWEQGTRKIEFNMLLKLCEILDIDVVKLTTHMKKYI